MIKRQQLNFISTLSMNKTLNASKILGSYYRSRLTGSPKVSGLPLSISIEPTTACNLRCPECPSGLRSFVRPTGKMDLDLLNRILLEVKSYCSYINFYFQGEPYLHPQFLEMIKMARDFGLYASTSTNAHFLSDEMAEKTVKSGINQLIISIDGATQETYEQYRKTGKLKKVLQGAQNMVKWKKKLKSSTPHIVFQMMVVQPNEHEIGEVKNLAREIGVDELRLKTAQIYDYENGSDLIPKQENYARYKLGVNGKWQIKNTLDNHCWRMWSGCVITWDGRVVPCCFDKDAEHSMGNLKHESLEEIWNSFPYQSFRKQILKSRSEVEMCKNCSEGTKVWA